MINFKASKFFLLNIFLSIFFSSLAVLPQQVFSQTTGYNDNPGTNKNFQIVPVQCTKSWNESSGDESDYFKEGKECGWIELLQLMRNLMAFMLYLTAALSTMAFCYAGFLYLTAFGNMGQVEKAHGIFSKVIIGFLFVFLGWLIVATLLKTLGVDKAFSLIDFNSVTEIK